MPLTVPCIAPVPMPRGAPVVLLLVPLLTPPLAAAQSRRSAMKGAGTATAAGRSGRLTLSDGHTMPVYGLGTYAMKPGEETEDAVTWALQMGYRMIDTAAMYRNEDSVGRAIAASGVPRGELFIATKLMPGDHGYRKTKRAFAKSLTKLGLDYVDLYIIHAPVGGKLIETWDAMVELQQKGQIRSIAVSNFGVEHLQALEEHGRPLPVLNQFEMHPLQYNDAVRQRILSYCASKTILVQAYGSMFWGADYMHNEVFAGIAQRHNKSNAQVLLRWALQKGYQIIPKSKRKERLKENQDIFDFELDATEMGTLSSMDAVNIGQYWNPLEQPVDLGETKKYRREEL